MPNGGNFSNSKYLWDNAHRRLVISDELGREYQRIFSNISYEVITDGVKIEEISVPKLIKYKKEYVFYFAGLLHIDYLPIFQVLASALDELSSKSLNFTLILRGTQKVKFLENRKFKLDYRPMTLDDKILKCELEGADILYLPLKFTEPEFYLFSLSTKMIGYLAASGTILFHGPYGSAACNLLSKNASAICCNSLDKDDVISSILNFLSDSKFTSENAKVLAKKEFMIDNIKFIFWGL